MVEFKFLIQNLYDKGRMIVPHGHNCYEFVYYFSGKGISHYDKATTSIPNSYIKYFGADLTDSNSFNFSSSSYTMFKPNTLHDEKHYDSASIIALGFDLKDKSIELDTNCYIDTDNVVLGYIRKIATEYKNKYFQFQSVIESYISQMLIDIKRKKTNFATTKEPIDYSIFYIDEHYMMDININALAINAGYSPDHFRILFKKKLGQNPKNYITKKRIGLAKHLLATTPLTITQISESCGFKYSSLFTVAFNQATGMNPLEYRKKHKA